jgi:DNA (cytosine-5)-methyltransferase 1
MPNLGDVARIDWGGVERPDLICGGFPCQDISFAGRGAGLAGARSGLWHEFARAVREVRPRLVLVENVAALLVRGLDAVLGTLASLGYDAEWHCIPAAAVGAPHIRDRIFILAYSQRGGCLGAIEHLGEHPAARRRRPPAHDGLPGETGGQSAVLADPVDHGSQGLILAGPEASATLRGRAGWWEIEPDVGRVADGIPARLDRLRCLGNAVVPQVAEWIGRLILASDHGP